MASAPGSSQQENDSASMSGSDSKKRNKLGYHRTAVACGHCRRRKIRCVPSNDSSETKCANCIRLKKECQFYPVDQNGTNTRKQRSDSRAEPSGDEPSLSRTSASPDHPTSSTSESYDTPYVGGTSSNGAWAETPNMVTSPSGRLGSLHALDQQEWTQSPGQNILQNRFSQPDLHTSATAGAYWMQNEDNSTINYQQQQYGITVTSGAFPQEPYIAYQNGFQDARHNTGRQSFSGVSNPRMDHSPNSYRHYNGTFPEIERSVTMPVNMFNHNTVHEVPHSGPQLVAGPGQFVYDQNFQPMPNSTQAWFSPNGQHAMLSPQYLPTHRDRKYSQYSS